MHNKAELSSLSAQTKLMPLRYNNTLNDIAMGGNSGNRGSLRLFHICRLLLGVVFVYASYDKILHPQAFAIGVFHYQILPDALINLVALILPWLELLLGLCLLGGVWLPGATVVGSGLMIVFIGALVFNQIRGLDIHCGCFSTEVTEGPAGLGTVLRDFGFLAVSLYLLFSVFIVSHRSKKSSPSQSSKPNAVGE